MTKPSDSPPPGGTLVEPRNVEPAVAAEDFPASDGQRYRRGAEHARGGLGRIVRAHDRILRREVALKELVAETPQSAARFVREAMVTARLQHPSIVPVYDAARWPSGERYYAMKMVDGKSLKDALDDTTSVRERLALLPNLIAVADAIAYAHSERVIHRDLKPANVIIGSFGETVVVDWGLAKDLADEHAADEVEVGPYRASAAGLTVTGAVVGTPAYMSPEQAAGKPVDERADVYALGAMLYHVLSGRLPYDGRDTQDLLDKVRSAPPVPVQEVEPRVQPDLATIVAKAMARDLDERYRSAGAMAADLQRFQTGQLVSAHDYSRGALVARWLHRHRALVVLGAVALVALAIVSAVSVRRILAESRAADRQRALAETARQVAERRSNELTLAQARSSLATDPTATLAWLETYPDDGDSWDVVRDLAADADSRGVARHVLRGHTGLVGHVEFAGDPRTLLSSAADGQLLEWDAVAGAQRRVVATDVEGSYFSVAEDGSAVAIMGDPGEVLVFDRATGTRAVLRGHDGAVWGVMFSPDARSLASCGVDGTIRLWDLATGEHRVLGRHDGIAFDVAFARTGGLIASVGSDRTVRVFEVDTGRERVLRGHTDEVHYVKFSPDGTHIASASNDATVRVWNVQTGASQVLSGHTGAVVDVDFSPDGERVASASLDHTVRVLTLESGDTQVYGGHLAGVYAVVFSPDGERLVAGDASGKLILWHLSTREATHLRGHTSAVHDVTFAHDGSHVASASADESVRVWPVPVDVGRRLVGHSDAVEHVVPGPGGGWVTTGSDRSVRYWPSERAASEVLGEHADQPRGLAVSGDGHLVASLGRERVVQVWEFPSRAHATLADEARRPTVIAFASAGRRLVAGGERGDVWISDWSDPASLATPVVRALPALDSHVTAIGWSADGARVAAGSMSGAVIVVDVKTRAIEHSYAHGGIITAIGFSPGGHALASASVDGTVALSEVATGTRRMLTAHTAAVVDVSFSADGQWLVTAGNDRALRTWRVATAEPDVVFAVEANRVAMSPVGNVVAAAAEDGSVRVWGLDTGSALVLRGHEGTVFALSFSADGAQLASASFDKSVRLWSLRGLERIGNEPGPLRAWLRAATSATIGTETPLTSQPKGVASALQ